MTRFGVLLAVAVAPAGLSSGCKLLPHPPADAGGESAGLLIGPDAAGKTPAPAELPARESAKVCLRTAAEFEKTGQTEAAIEMNEKARSLDPAVARQAGRRLAVLYDRAGDFAKATAEYEPLLQASPADAVLLNDAGYSYYSRGDWAAAEAYLARAVAADPGLKTASMNHGLALAQLGRWDDAYLAFCKAVRPPDAHCNLGFVLATRGRTADAKDQYRRALALDPGMTLAQAALAKLNNPTPPGEQAAKAAAGKGGAFDPGEAAAKVPTFAELEARLKKPDNSSVVTASADEAKAVAPK